jgi:endonuclease YncB( thermonuclease family)
MRTRTKRGLIATLIAVTIACSGVYFSGASAQDAKSSMLQSYQELFDKSLKEKKGLNFYMKGQTIGAVVVKMIGNDAIEVRNQAYGRIIIRLDSIDAVAIN